MIQSARRVCERVTSQCQCWAAPWGGGGGERRNLVLPNSVSRGRRGPAETKTIRGKLSDYLHYHHQNLIIFCINWDGQQWETIPCNVSLMTRGGQCPHWDRPGPTSFTDWVAAEEKQWGDGWAAESQGHRTSLSFTWNVILGHKYWWSSDSLKRGHHLI